MTNTLTALLSLIAQNPMAVALLVIVLIAIIILWAIQRTKDNFDLRALITDEQTKQPSIHKLGQLTALVMSTWLLVYLALQNRMDSVYFTTYMGIWAAAQAINQWTSGRGRTSFGYGGTPLSPSAIGGDPADQASTAQSPPQPQ